MSLKDELTAAGLSRLNISPGDVFIADDKAVVIPRSVKSSPRKYHEVRTCVVMSNNVLCSDLSYPIVSIAPTTHLVNLKTQADFPILPNKGNGLDLPSLVMLGHIQPVRKVDLRRKIGSLSLDEWERLLEHVVWNFDRL
jgi:mRNA-degrading endonuclease toxin of MazEF toxin-antitoxin module